MFVVLGVMIACHRDATQNSERGAAVEPSAGGSSAPPAAGKGEQREAGVAGSGDGEQAGASSRAGIGGTHGGTGGAGGHPSSNLDKSMWIPYAQRIQGSTGVRKWVQQWGGTDSMNAYDVATDGESIYVASERYVSDDSRQCVVSRRRSSDGSPVWERALNGTLSDQYYIKPRIALDTASTLVVVYSTVMARFNRDGSVVWENDDAPMFRSVAVDGAGAIYAGFDAAKAHKLATDGTTAWKATLGIGGSALAVSNLTGNAFRLVATGSDWSATLKRSVPAIVFLVPGQ